MSAIQRILGLAAVSVFLVHSALANLHRAVAHPLDPLTEAEIGTTLSILRDAHKTDGDSRFALIDLDEPAKSVVLAGLATPRKAFIVARRRRVVQQGVINLTTHAVESWVAVPNVQSTILPGELREAREIVSRDAGWRAALRRRGYDAGAADLFCAPLSAGYLADPAEEGRRLLKVTCFDRSGTRNVWSRPIEGLVAVVDLDREQVIRLIDSGAVPVSRDPAELPDPAPVPATAAAAEHPHAAGYRVEGNEVQWRNWAFHYRLDPRTGLVVSLVRYRDQGRDRMVLYRGSLSEMFVPYMDPDPAWSFRTFMDVGEYGLGALSLPLTPPADCPAGAMFLDATLADEHGEAQHLDHVICLFERDTDAPLWRHAETAEGSQSYAGQPAHELVMRTIPSVGNYDYVIDWVLTEAGTIRIDVGATGIDAVKAVRAATMNDPSARQDTRYGTLVAPHLVAVNHDHFLSFRLDVDIDGPVNTLVRQQLVPERLSGRGGRRSLWRVVERKMRVEGPVRPDMHGAPELWRIENPTLTNSLGQHPGYELRPGHSATSLLAPDDWPQRRAAFSAAPLWVTAYDRGELYAGGSYPNQSRADGGLAAYVANHRRVAGTDIVLWYTIGFDHVPRPEDWPVLPTMWHGVLLVPYGFFDRQPRSHGTAQTVTSMLRERRFRQPTLRKIVDR